MFDALRKMIFPIIFVVLFFFVAMIVLEWGLGFSGGQQAIDQNLAAVINGEEITWQDYNTIYQSILQTEIRNTPEGDISDDQRRILHDRAWQQLVHDRVILQEVGKRDIRVTADEIYSYLKFSPPPELQVVPSFQTDGKFDYQKYMLAMADPQASPFWASIEPFVKTDIMKLKLQEMIIGTATISEEQVKQAYLRANEKIKVGVVNVSFDRFSRPPPATPDDELRAYFEENRDDYYLDERRGLNVVLMEKAPKPYDWELSYNRAKQIYDSVQAGADFAELAKSYSADGSAENGGDLGWFDQGQMVPEFDQKVFSINVGDVTEPVKTQFGWHIIKLHERKEEPAESNSSNQTKPVKKAHASHILIKAEMSRETQDEIYNQLELFRTTAEKSGFLKAAEDLKISVRSAQPFFNGKNIQYIGNNPKVSDFAFNNELNAISDLWENNSSYFVVQVSQILPAGPATFEEATEKLKLNLLKHKVMTICRDTANAIWAEIQAGKDIQIAAKNHGFEYKVLEPFGREDFTSDFRRDPKAIGTAFSMTEPGQMKGPSEYSQGMLILELVDRITPDLTDYNSKRDSIYFNVMSANQQDLYARWFDNLVRNSVITNNVEKAMIENPDFL